MDNRQESYYSQSLAEEKSPDITNPLLPLENEY